MNAESLEAGKELLERIKTTIKRLEKIEAVKRFDTGSAGLCYFTLEGLRHDGSKTNLQVDIPKSILGNAPKIFLTIAETELKAHLAKLEEEFKAL